ncbi:MAG: alpha/beta hydrolase family protein [Phycisphaeraceae bacterium]
MSQQRDEACHGEPFRTEFAFVPSGGRRLATSVDLPAEGAGPWPTALVMHGLTGNRIGRSYHLVEFGRRLAASGIACVRFDQSGCGESTGRFIDLTIPRMVADAQAVRGWVAAQDWCDALRVGYVGVSMGALPAVAVDAARPGAALALWAPVYDMPRVFWRTARTGLRGILEGQGWVPYRGLPVGKPLVDRIDAVDTAAELAGNDSPVLLMHSQADETVPFEESEAYAARCAALGRPCRFEVSRTANHDFSDYEDRRRLLGTTVKFLAAQVGVTQAMEGA